MPSASIGMNDGLRAGIVGRFRACDAFDGALAEIATGLSQSSFQSNTTQTIAIIALPPGRMPSSAPMPVPRMAAGHAARKSSRVSRKPPTANCLPPTCSAFFRLTDDLGDSEQAHRCHCDSQCHRAVH